MEKKSIIPRQAVLLAAGKNSRFVPFRRKRHKSTFAVMGESLIVKTLQSFVKAGVVEVCLVRASYDKEIELLVKKAKLGLKLKFFTQPKPLGQANALLQVRHVLQKRFLVVNAGQINADEHLRFLNRQGDLKVDEVVLFSQKTDQPEKYGILALRGRRVKRVVEKPKSLKDSSNQRIIGIYLLTQDFVEFMAAQKSTEYQLEVALNQYAQGDKVMAVESKVQGLTLKYAWDLFSIAEHRFGQWQRKPRINGGAWVHPTAQIEGPVVIETGARVYEFSIIKGPCYIGKNVVVGSYCKVRKGAVLEEGVELQNGVEVKHSLIGRGTAIHSGFVGDSIIGEEVRIGAGFITANRRLDRGKVRVRIKGKRVDTGSGYFGCLIGDKAKIGIHCGTNPGTIIEEGAKILPGTVMVNSPKLSG